MKRQTSKETPKSVSWQFLPKEMKDFYLNEFSHPSNRPKNPKDKRYTFGVSKDKPFIKDKDLLKDVFFLPVAKTLLILFVCSIPAVAQEKFQLGIQKTELRGFSSAHTAQGLGSKSTYQEMTPNLDEANILSTSINTKNNQLGTAGILLDTYTGRVHKILPGSTTYNAGLRVGDRIIAVDGVISIPGVAESYQKPARGAPGTQFYYSLADGRQILVTRVDSRMFANNGRTSYFDDVNQAYNQLGNKYENHPNLQKYSIYGFGTTNRVIDEPDLRGVDYVPRRSPDQ